MSVTEQNPESEAATGGGSKPLAGEIRQFITLPRWLVYFQAALLGIVATTFFIFGLMVGSLTSGNVAPAVEKFDCRVSGVVEYFDGNNVLPDEGAVVFLLPRDGKPQERAAASSVSPDSFLALDNPGIEVVHQLGGAIVRADQNGEFEVVVDASLGDGVDYFFLVVSRNKQDEEAKPLSKQQVAAIGSWFLPVERVMNDRAIFWDVVNARSERAKLTTVRF